MAVVLNRTTKQLIPFAHTPNFPVADWIINPDLSAVAGQPTRYFIITGDVVTLASAAEQVAIDAVIAEALLTSARDGAKNEFDDRRELVAFAKLLIIELNELRLLHGLPKRTFAQLRNALRGEIDTG